MTVGHPIKKRTAARVIVRDSGGRLLLFRGTDPHAPSQGRYWFTAGGGLDPGETFEQAAERELLEETGLTAIVIGGLVHTDEVEFSFESVTYRQLQHFFAVEVPLDGTEIELNHDGFTDYEARSVSQTRWWSLEELAATDEAFYPANLAEIVGSVASWGTAGLVG
jgi:8-oxo-dGTP pyrophosphatase MutT (NUDIX family)